MAAEAAFALALFAGALAVRAIRLPLVVTARGIDFPYPGDLFYHVRRIVFSAERFPEVLRFDRYVSFPDGAEIVWTGAFDLAIAGLARAFGAERPAEVEAFAVWVPPVLGALTALAVAWLARRLYGRAAGVAAGLIFAALPVSFVFSQLGQLDHHVAVALAATLLLAAATALLASPRPGPRAGLVLGFAMAAVIGLWPGTLVDVLIVQLGALAWVLGAADGGLARTRAHCLSLAHAAAALLLAPFCLGRSWAEYGSWSPFVLSNFQPVWLGATALALALAGQAFARTSLGRTPARRAAAVGALGLAGAGAALAALPALREAAREASGWFRQSEAFQEHVNELRPLLFPRGELDFGPVIDEFSFLAWLFPLALAALAVHRFRRGLRPVDGLLLLWTAGFLALTLNQRRFESTFSVAYALVWGAVLGEVAPAAFRALRGRTALRALALALAALVAFATADSLHDYYRPHVRESLLMRRGIDPPRNAMRVQQRLFERAGRFLRRATPPTRGWLDPSQQPEYGVLSNWGAGHLLRYRSQRPMVQDNFGVYGGRRTFDLAWEYYETGDEGRAAAILDGLGARYVVADPLGAGSHDRYPPDAMARRLAQHFGSERELSGGGGEVAALVHHRLLFHTASGDARTLVTARRDPAVSVWERVPGARVRGTAAPGARVVAKLALQTVQGRSHAFAASARADAQGAFELTLPYPTDEPFSSALRVLGSYALAAGERSVAFEVPEAAVRAGGVLEGPAL